MTDRLTRQGVPNLESPGHNGHRAMRRRCRHFFAGPEVVVELEWSLDWNGEPYQREVYGQRCMHCGEARRG